MIMKLTLPAILSLLAVSTTTTSAFSPQNHVASRQLVSSSMSSPSKTPLFMASKDEKEKKPSKKGKLDADTVKEMMEDVSDDVKEELSRVFEDRELADNFHFMQSLGAITSRGEFATAKQRKSAESVLISIEDKNPTEEPADEAPLIFGTWELLYSTTELFRSSPFFMAGRAVCTTDTQRDQFNWFCDMHRKALAISNIGPVRQIIAPGTNNNNKLISEFEIRAGSVPFLADFTPFKYSGGAPVTIDGALVSTADWTPTNEGTAFKLHMDTVEVKGSNLPGLRQVLDQGLKLQSRSLAELLENNVSGYTAPRPILRTTYLDETFRISRDQDGNAFLYVKTSTSTEATDYSGIDADLGVGRLLEGFNDAVTKLYM